MKKFIPLILIIIISLSITLLWFRQGEIMGAGESGLIFYDLNSQLQLARFSWGDSGLGNSLGIGVAAAPTYWLFSRIQSSGVPASIIQAIFFAIILCVAGFSIYFLTKEIFPQLEGKFVFLAVLFYWFNPISMVNVWNRFLYNYMVFWALLPLASFLFIKGLIEKDFRYVIFTSVSTMIFSFALTSIPFNIILWFLFFYTTLFFICILRQNIRFILEYFCLSLIFFVFLNFWWISQTFSFISSSSKVATVGEFFTSVGNLSTLSALSQRLGNFVDITRLMHNTFYVGPDVSWARIYTFSFLVLLEFFFAIMVFWIILKFRRKWQILYFGGLFLISLFLAKGNNPPLGKIFEWFFIKYSYLQVFRNPFEKFGFLLAYSFTPLFVLGISKFAQIIKKSKIRTFFLFLSFLYVFILLGFPFWTGLVFTREEKLTGNIINYQTEVPGYYKEANDWFKKQAGNFRFISLPLGGEGITYTWEKPYSGVELSSILFNIPNISFNTSIPLYSQIAKNLERLILTKDNILSAASLLNAKYILVRKDVDWRERGLRDPETIGKFLDSNPTLNRIKNFGSLSVYMLTPNDFSAEISVPSSTIRVFPLASFEDFIVAKGLPRQAIYSLPDENELPNTQKILIKPIIIFFSPKQKPYNTQNVLAELLYVKYLPDSRFYNLALLKQSIERVRIVDAADLFIFDLTRSGKRIVELYRLSEKQTDERYIEKAAAFYLKTFDDLVKNYPERFENSAENVFWKIISEEFNKHLGLLKDARQKTSGKNFEILGNALQGLEQRMTNLGFKSIYSQPDDSKIDSWVFRFDVPENGIYNIRLENNQWKQFYDNLPSLFQLQIDNKVIAIAPVEGKDFISFGGMRFEKGVHEIRLENPERKNLLGKIKGDVELFSSTNPEVSFDVSPFDPFESYEVSFDYWIRKGNSFEFLVYGDNDPEGKEGILPGFTKKIITDDYNNDFMNQTIFVSPRSGANSIKITFKIDPFLICPRPKLFFKNSCKDKDYIKNYSKETQVVIRNISVKKLFNNKIVLLEDRGTKEVANPSVSFSKVNPTEYKVHIEKATNPYVLILSNLYSSGWEARFQDGTKVNGNKHFLINSYANGWLIDKPGSYDLTIKFAPQDLLDAGKKISLFSSAGALFLLGVYIWRRRRLSN